MTNEELDSIRINSVAETDSYSYNAWYKSVCRWYSREFSTPLPQVLDMSEQSVIETYYDDIHWKLKTGSDEQKKVFNETILSIVTANDPETKNQQEQYDAEDDDWYLEELSNIEKQLNNKNSNKNEDKDLPPLDPNLKDETTFIQGEDFPIED